MKKAISVLLTMVLLMGALALSVSAAPGDIRLTEVRFTDAEGHVLTALPENGAESIRVSATVQYENYYNPRHQKGTTTNEAGESYEAFCDVIDANAMGSVALYAAHYDADNKLIGLALLTNKIFGGNNTFSIPFETEKSAKISVLLWDGTNLKPLTQIKKLETQSNGNKIIKFPYYEIGTSGQKYAVINNVDNIIWLETETESDEIMLNGRPNGQSDFAIDENATFEQPDYFYGGNDAVRVKNGMTCKVTAANGNERIYTIYLDKPLNGAKMGSNCDAIGDTAGLPSRSNVYWDANGFAKTGTIKTDDSRTYWCLDDTGSEGIILGMKDSVGGTNRNNKFYKTEYRMTFRMSDMKGNSWNKLFFNMGGLNADDAPVVKLGLSNEGDIAYASDGNAIGDGQQAYSLRYYHHKDTKGVHIKTLKVGEWVELKTVVRQGMAAGVPKVEIYVNGEAVYSSAYGYMDADAEGVAGYATSGLKTLDNYCYSSGSNGSFQIKDGNSAGQYTFDLDEIWAEGSKPLPQVVAE